MHLPASVVSSTLEWFWSVVYTWVRHGKASFFPTSNEYFTFNSLLFTAIGFFGYLRYGEEVMEFGSITLNLPNSPMNESVKLMFGLAIFLTFALQFYVPINILWPSIVSWQKLENRPRTLYLELLFRAALVCLTFGIAAAIPKLDLLISLVGALSSSSLALIFPPCIELLVRSGEDDLSSTRWTFLMIKNLFIIIFGLIGFVTGTYIAMKKIIENV